MTGRRCSVCSRDDVQTINKALVKRGASVSAVARRFGISGSSASRHFKAHIPKAVTAAKNRVEQEVEQGFDVMAWIREDRRHLENIIAACYVEDDETGELIVSDKRTLTEVIRVSGQMAQTVAKVQGDIAPEGVGEVRVVLSMNERAEEA